MPQRTLLRRLLTGTLWSGLALLAVRGLTTATLMVVARWLGPAAFGWVSLPHQVGGMTGTAAGYGLATASTKAVSESLRDDTDPAAVTLACERSALRMAAALSIAGLLIAAVLALLGQSSWSVAAGIGGPLAGLTVLQLTQFGLFASLGAYRRQAVSAIVATVAGSLLLLAAAWVQSTAVVLAGLLLLLAIQGLVLVVALRAELRSRGWTAARAGTVAVRNVALPATLVAIFGVVGQLAGFAILWTVCGEEQFGFFTAANQWFVLLMFVPATLANVLFPMLVQRASMRSAVAGFACVVTLATVPAAIALLLSSEIASVLGPSYAPMLPALRLTLWTVAAAAVLRPSYLGLASVDRLARTPWVALAAALLLVGLAWTWRDDGAAGLAAARLVAFSAHATVALALLVGPPLLRRPTTSSFEPSGAMA